MSPTINISSSSEFQKILGSSTIVLTDCEPPSLDLSAMLTTISLRRLVRTLQSHLSCLRISVHEILQQAISSQYGVSAYVPFLNKLWNEANIKKQDAHVSHLQGRKSNRHNQRRQSIRSHGRRRKSRQTRRCGPRPPVFDTWPHPRRCSIDIPLPRL
jgi:hypothetical protein